MRLPLFIPAIFLALPSTVLSLPLPQLAGEGAACDSILTQTDNGVGHGVESAEENTAATISSISPPHRRRQLAGEGSACNSILSQTDNGVGHGVENAEENTASLITTLKGSAPHRSRQLDKIATGAQAIGNAAGVGQVTEPFTTASNSLDGVLTNGAANLGADVGNVEDGSLEAIGKAVPRHRRQLDKTATGAQAIGNAAGVGQITEPFTIASNSLDGVLTDGAANIGADVGNVEDGSLEAAGKAVPR